MSHKIDKVERTMRPFMMTEMYEPLSPMREK